MGSLDDMPKIPAGEVEHRKRVGQAEYEVGMAVSRAVEEHNLTYNEIASILGELVSRWAKYGIREERKERTDAG